MLSASVKQAVVYQAIDSHFSQMGQKRPTAPYKETYFKLTMSLRNLGSVDTSVLEAQLTAEQGPVADLVEVPRCVETRSANHGTEVTNPELHRQYLTPSQNCRLSSSDGRQVMAWLRGPVLDFSRLETLTLVVKDAVGREGRTEIPKSALKLPNGSPIGDAP